MKANRPDGGFTLLELLIVSALVIVIALVVIPSAQSVLGVQAREEASRLAGTIRAMYSEAVLSGRTCRIVFDMEESAYWPECAQGRVRIGEKEESIRGERVEEDRGSFARNDLQEMAMQELANKSAFTAIEGRTTARRDLPDDMYFDSVWAKHQPEVYTGGTSFLYFFPHGETERAYIYLGRGEDDLFTVLVDPVTGRTRVFGEKIEIPREELSR